MKHLVLTRFNVLMPGWNSQVNLDAKWLEERFKLFEEVCLPSVAGQTNQNFEWWVYFDINTPEKFKSKINVLMQAYAFKSIYVELFDLKKITVGIFESHLGEKMLLTSRLDSDDVLAIDYIDRLQKMTVESTDKKVINFDQGAILHSKNNQYSLYRYEDDSNPFTSLLEPFVSNLSTILAVKHTELHAFSEVVHVKEKPMWLQVVHGGNVSNRVRGTRVSINQYNNDFVYMRKISGGVTENRFTIIFDNCVLGIYRKLRDFIRGLLKSIYLRFKK